MAAAELALLVFLVARPLPRFFELHLVLGELRSLCAGCRRHGQGTHLCLSDQCPGAAHSAFNSLILLEVLWDAIPCRVNDPPSLLSVPAAPSSRHCARCRTPARRKQPALAGAPIHIRPPADRDRWPARSHPRM